MQRYRTYEPDQHCFLTLDPTVTFGPKSFETFLVTTIKDLDLNQFWTNEDRGGEAPYDPRAMLGIILYGFCRGIFSSRKLEHACRNDLGFMYVSGHNSPDHAAICRFLKRFGNELKLILRQLVYVAHRKGYIDYQRLALDGTKIRANVARTWTGTLADFRKRVEAIDQFVAKAMVRLENSTVEDTEHLEAKIAKAKADQTRIKEFLSNAQEIITVAGTERKQSIVDPDCSVMVMPDGTCREAYNAQACVDDKSGIIVGETVVQSQNDMKLLNPVLDVVINPEHVSLDGVQVLADAGYWHPEQLAEAEQRGFEVYVPDPSSSNPHKIQEKPEQKPVLLSIENKDGVHIAYCSGGKAISAAPTVRKHSNRNQGDTFYVFQTSQNGECLACPLRQQCYSGGKKKKLFSMSVMKAKYHGVTRKIAERLSSEQGLRVFSRRMPLIERTFAEIKATLGFRKFLRRSLVLVETEWSLICSAFNLRRMFAIQQQETA